MHKYLFKNKCKASVIEKGYSLKENSKRNPTEQKKLEMPNVSFASIMS